MYLIIPFSIPNPLITLLNLRKSFNCPKRKIPLVPRYTATTLFEISLTNRLIAVLIPEYNDVFIKFILLN